MGNGYHQSHLHHQNFHNRSTFLPTLCRVSIKDIKLSRAHSSSSDDPSSPRVSCMGQVKRNNKVNGFPTPYKFHSPTSTTTKAHPHNHHMKYTKLKRLLSGKNLTATTTTAPAAAIATSSGCNSRRGMIICDTRRPRFNYHNNVPVNIVELDPPLPVVRRVEPPATGRDEGNLWKRRSGKMALKGLQIEQINVPDNQYLPPASI
ncbi:unnamed protein product [Ilex paraguariensis]|uniref:Uncharacterized protein n=1 Tax=Ilex paraguariensis TaxID=185542 RepID=A0ABC8TFJ7_9AQUA